jgi:hypothetical protein
MVAGAGEAGELPPPPPPQAEIRTPQVRTAKRKNFFILHLLLISTFCSILFSLGLDQEEVQEWSYLLKDHSSISPLRAASAGLL